MTPYSPNIEYTSFGTKVTLPVKEVRSISNSAPNLWGSRELKVNYKDGSEVSLSGRHDFIEVANIVVNAIVEGRRSGFVEGYDKGAHEYTEFFLQVLEEAENLEIIDYDQSNALREMMIESIKRSEK